MRNLVSLLLLAAVLTPLWAAGDEEGAAGEAELANLNRTGLPIVNDQVTLTVMGREAHLGVCRIGRTEEAKECWSGLRSDYRLHESMLSQIV